MQRMIFKERETLRYLAKSAGFTFFEENGVRYWNETAAYRFSTHEIKKNLQGPFTEMHDMIRNACAHVVSNRDLMVSRYLIPENMVDLVASSWRNGDPELMGRFDVIYDGKNPAKMLEYNADTPSTLFEASSFQAEWFSDMIDSGYISGAATQFNQIGDKMRRRFSEMFQFGDNIHFAELGGDDPEGHLTLNTMMNAAHRGGLNVYHTSLEGVGISNTNQFTDDQNRIMWAMVNLYPWEDMLRDDFAQYIADSSCQFVEPPWKALINKAILVTMWELYEDHPNLLPTFFADDMKNQTPIVRRAMDKGYFKDGFVEKRVFSRQGNSIKITDADHRVIAESARNDFADFPSVIQAYVPIVAHDGARPVLGLWVVGEKCVGLGIRESRDHITQDADCFCPHFVLD